MPADIHAVRHAAAGQRNVQDAPADVVRMPHVAARRSLVLAACLMATFMAAVESTIVATAMPTIVADLGGFNLFSWVFAVYLLTQAVSIPVYGRLADIYGRKTVFHVGAGLFLIGSTLVRLRAEHGMAGAVPRAARPRRRRRAADRHDDLRRHLHAVRARQGAGTDLLRVWRSRRWPARPWARSWWSMSAGARCSGSTCRSASPRSLMISACSCTRDRARPRAPDRLARLTAAGGGGRRVDARACPERHAADGLCDRHRGRDRRGGRLVALARARASHPRADAALELCATA